MEAERDLIKSWNSFIRQIVKARQIWNEELKDTDRKEIELTGSGKGMMLLGTLSRATFGVMMDQIVDSYRGIGGLEAYLEKEKPIIKEEIKGNGR